MDDEDANGTMFSYEKLFGAKGGREGDGCNEALDLRNVQ